MGRGVRRRSPLLFLAVCFLALILIGTGLLLLPGAQRSGVAVSWLEALFTATSAVCLVGLSPVAAAAWSPLGHGILLGLIQVGALIFMSVATLLAILLGLRATLRARLQLPEPHGVFSLREAGRIARFVVTSTLLLEGLGTLVLAGRLHFHQGLSWGAALLDGLYLSISAFCNAGFAPITDATNRLLPAVRTDGVLLGGLSLLILLGGLGLGVLDELVRLPQTRRLSVHAKLVLATTALLLGVGTALCWALEGANPRTLGDLPAGLAALQAWFLAVSARTAGFAPVDVTALTPPTLFVLLGLMLIGASPDSAGGGMKTTTVAILALAIVALLRRRADIQVFRRRLSGEMVRLALSLVTMYLLFVWVCTLAIGAIEGVAQPSLGPAALTDFARVGFEVVSAVGAVGLSAGVTPHLHPVSQGILIVAMLIGRLGPLAFVFAFAQPKRVQRYRLPEEPVMAG
jgi:trk system potassium uptake protein TrkH